MKTSIAQVVWSALFSILAGSAAYAQTQPDQAVTVNPAALPPQPEATAAPLPPVHLHPPPAAAHRAVSAAKPSPAVPVPAPAAAPPQTPTKPAPQAAVERGLVKQATVLFDNGSASLSSTGHAMIGELFTSLKTALNAGAQRVELIGYGGDPGDTSSAARRLSLERALMVRQALIGGGIPSERIDVRALGGDAEHGTTERVDVFIKN